MDRHATDLLAQFCIAQRKAFDPQDWHVRFDIDGEAVALAAKYLSMTSWYGHEDELEEIVAQTQVFGENSAGLHRESRAMDFDLPYFSAKVRLGIAAAQTKTQPRIERRHQRLAPAAGQADMFDGFRLMAVG